MITIEEFEKNLAAWDREVGLNKLPHNGGSRDIPEFLLDLLDVREAGAATPEGVVEVVTVGGGEGYGAPLWVVVSFESGDGPTQYFRYDGVYRSWDDDDWNEDGYEVHSVPVTTMEWRSISEESL